MKLSRRSALLSAGFGVLLPRMARAETAAAVPRERVEQYLPQLDELARDALRRTGVPGLSIAVVHGDRVVHLAGFGVRQAGKPEVVDADTVFELASMSKPIASTVVAALAGDGLVAWDDAIIKHDPAFAMHDAWVTREVTLRDMFCHRSGLPDHAGDHLEDIGYDRAAVLHRLRYIRPDSSFRSRYDYTNFGLTAAAVAAAKAAGKSWEDVSAERLYRPLGMTRTSSRFADYMAAANRAVGHVRQDGAADSKVWVAKYTRDPDAQSPAGGVYSSARDVAQWLRLQLDRGSLGGREIVRAAALDETHRPQIASNPAKNPMVDQSSFYGLGWGVGYEGGRIRWSHSGAFNLGAATCVNVLPAEQIGIVVLTNAAPIGVPEALCRSLLDLVLIGKVERDWFALFAQAMAGVMAPDYGTAVDYAKPPQSPKPALAAAAYVGSYHSELFGPAQVVEANTGLSGVGLAGAGLALKLGPKLASYTMHHFDRDVFTYQPIGENAYGPSAVTFTVGAGGKATAMTIENLDLNGQGTFRRTAN
jgi:CubicO group peptidase (beta-lactamase class C family)